MSGNIDNIFDYFELVGSLPKLERKIINLCYGEGRVTKKQLMREFGEDEKTITKSLKNLIQKKLIYVYKFQNIEFFEPSLTLIKFISHDKFPYGPVIPLVYQFNLLSDEIRTGAFKKAISKIVKPGDVVFDLGCGTGVLSMFAAQQGAFVFAIESDPFVADVAEYLIKNNGFSNRIKIIQGDSRDIKISEKADVIICEMLDTALIAELQVPVMNDALDKWVKPNTKVIPLLTETSAELVYTDYKFYDLEFNLIHFEEYGSRKSSNTLSDSYIYHICNFKEKNDLLVSFTFDLQANKDGITNGLRIKTKTYLDKDIVVPGTPWLNPPLILPFDEIKVNKGDRLSIKLSYGLGSGFSSIRYDVKKEDG